MVGQARRAWACRRDPADVLSSAQAAAALLAADLAPGARVLVCAGPGVEEALAPPGSTPVANDRELDAPVAAVVCGFHRDFDFDRLDRAAAAVRDGARFVATNADATYPGEHRVLPGRRVARGRDRHRVGTRRPRSRASREAADRGAGAGAGSVTDGIMVGDRPSTDGLLADAPRLAVRDGAHRHRRPRPGRAGAGPAAGLGGGRSRRRSCARCSATGPRPPEPRRIGTAGPDGSGATVSGPAPQEPACPRPPTEQVPRRGRGVRRDDPHPGARAGQGARRQGQLAQEQVQGFVDDLVDESRRRTDVLMDVVRKEIQRQVKTLGIATKDDLAKLEAKLAKQTKAGHEVGGEVGHQEARRRRRRRRRTARPRSRHEERGERQEERAKKTREVAPSTGAAAS